jgi:predicted acyl esterase
MRAGRATHLALIAGLTLLAAGCLGLADEDLEQAEAGPSGDQDVYNTSKGWSTPTEPRQYEALDGVEDTLEAHDGTKLSVGVFLPDKPGCDWNASELPEECQLPTVLEGGPYFLDGVDEQTFRPPTVEWFTTRGYAVVQVSLRGTGESGGCYEFKNPQDVDDMDATIDWIADQPWSNEKVGMIGRSYDGTAAWAGAASGNEHLETIVPISGAVDGPRLYYKNGTSEVRGFAQPAAYYLFAYGLVAEDPTYRVPDYVNTLCPEAAEDWVRGPQAGLTGDASGGYWQARDLTDDILENYDGSAWVVHGLTDYNVNPSQAVPFTQQMREEGIETRAWLGQWDHHYPDRVDEHRNVRWDWADQTLEWFDHYLEDEGDTPDLNVEVEDSLYNWRTEDTFPPEDATWQGFNLSADASLTREAGEEGTFALTGPPTGTAARPTVAGQAGPEATFTSEPLDEALRFSGLPRAHVTVEPTTPQGGWLFAELHDVWPDGTTERLGWAAMDLRYHDGGNTDPATLTPGEPVVAEMEFEPLDAHVAEGHRLQLALHKGGVADIGPSPSPEANVLHLGGGTSTLELPTIDRDVTVTGPPTVGEPTSRR